MNVNVEVNEFVQSVERVTATIDWAMFTGERYTGPLVVGIYPSDSEPEIFITQEGNTVQFPVEVLKTVIRQLKRAERIAKEQQ